MDKIQSITSETNMKDIFTEWTGMNNLFTANRESTDKLKFVLSSLMYCVRKDEANQALLYKGFNKCVLSVQPNENKLSIWIPVLNLKNEQEEVILSDELIAELNISIPLVILSRESYQLTNDTDESAKQHFLDPDDAVENISTCKFKNVFSFVELVHLIYNLHRYNPEKVTIERIKSILEEKSYQGGSDDALERKCFHLFKSHIDQCATITEFNWYLGRFNSISSLKQSLLCNGII